MKFITTILSLLLATTLSGQTKDDFLTGVAALKKSDYKIAEMHLSKALEKNKQSESILYYRGISYYHLGDYTKSIADFTRVNKFKDAELWLAKSNIQKTNFSGSIHHINNFFRLNGVDKVGIILSDNDFNSLLQTIEWQMYIEQLTFTSEENDLKDIRFQISKGNTTIARSILDNYQIAEMSSEMRFLSALVYKQEMLTELAIYEVSSAVAIDPENNENKIFLGNLLLDLEKADRAASLFQEVLHLEPEIFDLYPKLAKAKTMLGNFEEAEKQIEFYLNYFPTDREAIELASEIYMKAGKLTQALKQINTLFKFGKVNASCYLIRGEIYYRTGAYKFSSEDLSMYLDLKPNNSGANYQLGNAHHQLGNNSLACYYWKRAYRYGKMEAFEQLQKFCD